MTQDIPALITEARFRSFESDEFDAEWHALSGPELFEALADALEAEHQRAEAYLSDPDFDQEFACVKAERDRYHAALVEIRDYLNEDKGCWTPDLVDVLTVLDEAPNRPVCPQPCEHLSQEDAREGRTCAEHPCTCTDRPAGSER